MLFKSIPAFNNNFTKYRFPERQAKVRGVSLREDILLGSAPLFNRILHILSIFSLLALRKGVLPFESEVLTLAPTFINSLINLTFPFSTANIKGLKPL